MSTVLGTLFSIGFMAFLITSEGSPTNKKIYFEPAQVYLDNVSTITLQHHQNSVKSVTKLPDSTLKCTACKYGINFALWKFRKPDGTYPGLFKFIISMCKNFKIYSPNICEGMVKAMENETTFLLTNLNLRGGEICGLLFPSKCHTSNLSWSSDHWYVPIPPANKKKRNKPAMSKTAQLKVLHISDLHIDLQYKVDSPVDCEDPLCCRQGQKFSNQASRKAGYWGSYGYCDTPYWTVENLFAHASKQNFDYILWTGDLPAHNDWSQSRKGQVYLLNNLTSLLIKYFPGTPVFPALGNHESNPVNSFPPSYIKGENNISWLYNALAKAWSAWLPKSAIKTVKQSGFYTTLFRPGFRIISLNMNYCNSQNYWMLVNPEDPNNELKWFVKVLTSAEENNETVHVIGHIPPSAGGDCLKIWRNNYYRIIERFNATITAQFFGHTHSDEIEIVYTDSSLKIPVSMAYICPSVTTYVNSNPAYRTYDVTSSDGTIRDHHTYVLNLTEANQPGSVPSWNLEYSARQAYNLSDLSIQSWQDLYESWIVDATTKSSTFLHYYRNFYKGHVPSNVCDKQCVNTLLCRIAAGNFTNPSCTL